MKATLEKLLLTSFKKDDQIQLRVDKEHVGAELLKIRRGKTCLVKIENQQSEMTISHTDKETGEISEVTIENAEVEFVSDSISISLAILEDGIIATITITIPNKQIIEKLLEKGFRGRGVTVDFF